ncbi:hypothetical protein, partial [Staphylococcus aureus]
NLHPALCDDSEILKSYRPSSPYEVTTAHVEIGTTKIDILILIYVNKLGKNRYAAKGYSISVLFRIHSRMDVSKTTI